MMVIMMMMMTIIIQAAVCHKHDGKPLKHVKTDHCHHEIGQDPSNGAPIFRTWSRQESARSVRHDLVPNIFPALPLSQ